MILFFTVVGYGNANAFGRTVRCFAQLMLAPTLASTASPPSTSGASSSSSDSMREFVEDDFAMAASSDAPSAAFGS